jgi:serine/threonine-protein kinase HipA
MADELAIWLYGDNVATVSREPNNRLRLLYTPEALAKYELGTPLLSIGLPLTDVAYANAKTRSFLDGLLPEEDQRRAVAEQLNLNSNDTFGLIRALGLDCAGAIVVQPAEDPVPRQATTLTVRGHEKVPAGGHVRSPLVAMKSPHRWPGEVPTPH